MTDVIGIAIEKWTHKQRKAATDWLYNLYGYGNYETWYVDVQPAGIEDLVMRKDIYFMFTAAFGEDYGSAS